jgi:hypothetical protein
MSPLFFTHIDKTQWILNKSIYSSTFFAPGE